jgi:hypothetical protein
MGGPGPGAARVAFVLAAPVLPLNPPPPAPRSYEARREPGGDLTTERQDNVAAILDAIQRAYFHSQSLLFVFPSASASYSKTVATAFRRLSFGESL